MIFRIACAVLAITLPAGCGGDLGERLQSGQVLAWSGLQGRWAGPVVPQDPSCGQTTQGLMSIGSKGFALDPFQSTTVIQGDIAQDGRLSGKFERLGGEHQNVSISFDATPAQPQSGEETINGTLTSGRCQWSVTLHRA